MAIVYEVGIITIGWLRDCLLHCSWNPSLLRVVMACTDDFARIVRLCDYCSDQHNVICNGQWLDFDVM